MFFIGRVMACIGMISLVATHAAQLPNLDSSNLFLTDYAYESVGFDQSKSHFPALEILPKKYASFFLVQRSLALFFNRLIKVGDVAVASVVRVSEARDFFERAIVIINPQRKLQGETYISCDDEIVFLAPIDAEHFGVLLSNKTYLVYSVTQGLKDKKQLLYTEESFDISTQDHVTVIGTIDRSHVVFSAKTRHGVSVFSFDTATMHVKELLRPEGKQQVLKLVTLQGRDLAVIYDKQIKVVDCATGTQVSHYLAKTLSGDRFGYEPFGFIDDKNFIIASSFYGISRFTFDGNENWARVWSVSMEEFVGEIASSLRACHISVLDSTHAVCLIQGIQKGSTCYWLCMINMDTGKRSLIDKSICIETSFLNPVMINNKVLGINQGFLRVVTY